jgi:hypothetical protein
VKSRKRARGESPVWVFNNIPAGARVDTKVSCPLRWPPGSVGERVAPILDFEAGDSAAGAVRSR